MNSPRNQNLRPRRAAAFSLIELLVVVGILSLLLGLGVSTVDVWKSQTLSTSGNRFVDYVAMARQNSIAKNVYTAVVIKTKGEGAYSAFCLLELSRPDDNTSGTWKQVTPWSTLKTGVVFAPVTDSSFLSVSGNPPADLPTDLAYHGKPVNFAYDAAAQVFQPDGTLSAGQGVKLRLVEGYVGDADAVTYTRPGKGSAANYYDIVFVRDSGQAKIERL